jgi:hypothetical protein
MMTAPEASVIPASTEAGIPIKHPVDHAITLGSRITHIHLRLAGVKVGLISSWDVVVDNPRLAPQALERSGQRPKRHITYLGYTDS